MKNLIVPGVLGIGIFLGFLTFLFGGFKRDDDQAPLIVIAILVGLLLLYDFYLEIKAAREKDK